MSTWMICVAIYGAGNFIMLLIMSYFAGQHYGEVHKSHEADPRCGDPFCQGRKSFTAFVVLAWPLVLVLVPIIGACVKFEEGGANSKLPPLNSSTNEEPKKKDIEWLG